jgi:hypothetical protein
MATRRQSGIAGLAGLARALGVAILVFACGLMRMPDASALTISLIKADPVPGDPLNGAPGSCDIGTGNLDDIVQAAATRWERSIRDNHTLTVYYGWAPNGGGSHVLLEQGGSPNRETVGQILFNNNCVPGNFHWFLDPNPKRNEEYLSFSSVPLDLSAGPVEAARFLGIQLAMRP